MNREGLIQSARSAGWDRFADALQQPRAKTLFDGVKATAPLAATDDPAVALRQLARHGLASPASSAMTEVLRMRPAELALWSWDQLTGTIILDSARVDSLRTAARALRSILPPAGERGVASTDASLTATAYGGGDALLEALSRFELGAFEQVQQLRPDAKSLLEKSGVLTETRSFAGLLNLAHAPTLASFYFHYLWRRFQDADAWRAWCEVLFDAEAPERVAADATPAPNDPEFLEYCMYRAAVARRDALEAHLQLDTALATREQMGMPVPPALMLVRAELEARARGGEVPLDAVAAIVAAAPDWRYAARVHVTMLAARDPDGSRALAAARAYVTRFGNDFQFWYRALSVAPSSSSWRDELLRDFAAEALANPGDVEIWKSLAPMVSNEPEALIAEVRARVTSQSVVD